MPWLIHGLGRGKATSPAWFENLATVKQIHSATVVSAEGRCGVLGQGDALLEDRPGSVVAIKTADCMPILLVDERHRVVAAVHAGWRGTVAHIAGAAVEAMKQRFRYGSSRPARGHRSGNREVLLPGGARSGHPVWGAGKGSHFPFGCQSHATARVGSNGESNLRVELCTMCLAEEFHSFRRDGEAGGTTLLFCRDTRAKVRVEARHVHVDLSEVRAGSPASVR
ncbi:MAG: polyphenol oxidase family protein [Ignavibacteriota bacterium]